MPLQRARWLVLTPETWRDDLLRIVLRVIAWFGGAVCLPSVFFALRLGKTGLATLDTVAITAVFALAYFRRIPERLRAAGTGLVMYALGAGLMIEVGPISQIYLFGFSLLTALLLGARWGLATVVLNASTMIVIGYAGFAAPTMVAAQGKWSSGEWAVVTGNFVFVNASLVVAMGLVIDALETALGRAVAA